MAANAPPYYHHGPPLMNAKHEQVRYPQHMNQMTQTRNLESMYPNRFHQAEYSDEDKEVETPRNQWGMASAKGDVYSDVYTNVNPLDEVDAVHWRRYNGYRGPVDLHTASRAAHELSMHGKSWRDRPAASIRKRTPSPENYYHPMLQGNAQPWQQKSYQDKEDDRSTHPDQWGTRHNAFSGRGPTEHGRSEMELRPSRRAYQMRMPQDQPPPMPWEPAQSSSHMKHPNEHMWHGYPSPPESDTATSWNRRHQPPPTRNFSQQTQAHSRAPEVQTQKATIQIASLVDLPPPKPATLSIASFVDAKSNTGKRQESDADAAATSCMPCGSMPLVSVGSVGHPHTCGEPCKYVLKSRGCKDGASCTRCHLCKWSRYGWNDKSNSK